MPTKMEGMTAITAITAIKQDVTGKAQVEKKETEPHEKTDDTAPKRLLYSGKEEKEE